MPSNEVTVMPEAGRPDTTKALELAGGLTLDEVKSIGTVFHQSGLFKDTKSAAAAITKVLAGQEMGVPPMEAMRGFHVYEGNVHFSSALVAALIKRSRKYDYRIKEANDSVCVIEWREAKYAAGTFPHTWEVVGESSFTREEAQAADLLRKANWKTYAEDMLFARALTRGARRYCPDVFGGAVYVPGEDAPEQEDRPEPFIQKTPDGGYTPPRVASLHDEGFEESRSASSTAHEGAAHTTDEAASPGASSAAPSGTDPLFPPTESEVEALEAEHRDPQA